MKVVRGGGDALAASPSGKLGQLGLSSVAPALGACGRLSGCRQGSGSSPVNDWPAAPSTQVREVVVLLLMVPVG